ncbi:zinc finger C3H1 domain-containing protein-like isoform X2 [Dunckerocampus dactyliophorus]|uniref:zinc finger C3H1 domain-containing protein-like isoform X2 n=1 Tax=Dunckerocampus dactyliophorus TaxID=161453 RepID=UPI0024053E16|nr:zinc finger C3H1 domain-containing protein-like isoform X2 [Dunckerocampus dactyliophorus]
MSQDSVADVSRDETELEDGEICDDDGEDTAAVRRGEGNSRPGCGPARVPMQPYMVNPAPDYRRMMPYDVHGPPNHRQQCGPSGPDRPHGTTQPPPMCGPGPRPSFWERSHDALGRFRHRAMPNGGRGAWHRGGWAGGGPRAQMGRYGPGENNNWKQKQLGRNMTRRAPPGATKCDGGFEETFEDLLSKYKQIQLELECIRKEESKALEAKGQDVETKGQVVLTKSLTSETKGQGVDCCRPAKSLIPPEASGEGPSENKKSFQAFNIKPLRAKLSTPVSLDTSVQEEEAGERATKADTEQKTGKQAEAEVVVSCMCCDEEVKHDGQSSGRESPASSEDVYICLDELGDQVEEEDLSELQLRLLALQSASKKWQQKEQQVMKRTREPVAQATTPNRLRVTTRSATADRSRSRSKPQDRERDKYKAGTRPPERDRPKQSSKPGAKTSLERSRSAAKNPVSKKSTGPGSTVKPPFRKQQQMWEMQEDDECYKREDEIRRIRDLSNQDEQYKRFMKLVGGKMHSGAKARDGELRKSTGKAGLDATGNLYQYDNYDEVAMDTDSEAGSPARPPFPVEEPAFVVPSTSTPMAASLPPPPPLPPPANEQAPPPKPPFADEEEEEEMLLRETCLMSMATKRVPAKEEKVWSGPSSPSAAPAEDSEQPSRGNLSAVNLNTMAASHGNKFTRGVPRTPLVLPRHKSVVVSLHESDDSDSDLDACSSTQGVIGGLEFMIKEARRTVEATKPKGASGSEKENNPLRTPEALPEAKKAEYRLLREELASREKQKASNKGAGPLPAAITATVDSLEQKLQKQRELLLRDETLLKNLLQQELKKTEALKAAESKVVRLKEQIQASEKIVLANKTLLKKLQEQVRRVEHRVSIKKTVAARLEQDLLRAQQVAGREPKRKAETMQKTPRKLQRVGSTNISLERHFADLMAQKQLLQQLESEYALKIQKLKEAQALRNKVAASEPPAELRPKPSVIPDPKACSPAASSPPLPSQPSLHDLTQDKLVLDSEDSPEAEDSDSAPVPCAVATLPRRHSLRQSISSTKPNLEQLTPTPAKDCSTSKPAKSSTAGPIDTYAGLDLDALRRRYQRHGGLGELLLKELHKVDEDMDWPESAKVLTVDVEATRQPSGHPRPVPFGPYRSPLLVFRSYRFSPYYRTKEKLCLSSPTYSNSIQPKQCFCRFDLTGTCNDDDCPWQHMRSCTLTGSLLFQDVLSYNLSLIGCSESSTDSQVSAATEKYLTKLFGPNKDGMGVDQKAVFLVSKVNESRRHVPPFTTWKDKRKWRPSAQSERRAEPEGEDDTAAGNQMSLTSDISGLPGGMSTLDTCVTSEDKRYFVSDIDDISKLESSVLDNPGDTQLWIKLTFRYLHQGDTPPAECLEAALNTLSRALENNCDDPEVWAHYLTLFSRRGSREEVQEMCEMAVEHAPDRRVWWNYLTLESSFEGKDYVCERLLNFLLAEASGDVSKEHSFQLLEAVLHRVHLNVFTGRVDAALAIFQMALKLGHSQSVAGHLMASDHAMAWLCYIHLKEFRRLPSSLYDPLDSGPSRLVSTEHFLLPWRTVQDISMPHDDIMTLFRDAISQCSDESLMLSERTSACLPLHTNFLLLHRLLDRLEDGVSMCETLLEACPESCSLRNALADLHVRSGNCERAVSLWLHALAECPNNAEVFYHCCSFLMAQDKASAITPLFRGFVLSLCEDERSHMMPVDILRNILGLPTDHMCAAPIIKKDLEEQINKQMSYLHLLHCRWLWLHGSVDDTLDAFERALGSAARIEELHRLWTDYLMFCSNPHFQSQAAGHLSELVLRCLSTVPSRLEVPFDPAHFWTCYRFHNKVVSLYLSCVDKSQHGMVLERLHYMMPTNIALALRLLHQEWTEGNLEHMGFQARMLTSSAPKSLASWKIAIAVETELRHLSEVRRRGNETPNHSVKLLMLMPHIGGLYLNIPEFSFPWRWKMASRTLHLHTKYGSMKPLLVFANLIFIS